MNISALQTLFRAQIRDKVAPYLISEDEFLMYLSEAQEEAVVRADLLNDRTSGITTVNVKAGIESYDIDGSIYGITTAYLVDLTSGEHYPLSVVTDGEIDNIYPLWREETERPLFIVHNNSSIQLSPKTDADYTLRIECQVMPDQITSVGCELQLSDIHHKRLLHWVNYRTYATQDNELFDKTKSDKELDLFEMTFGIRPTANILTSNNSNRPHRNKSYP